MNAILIPDYVGSIDIIGILTYTENNKMIPETEQAAMLPRLCGAGIVNDEAESKCSVVHSVLRQGAAFDHAPMGRYT